MGSRWIATPQNILTQLLKQVFQFDKTVIWIHKQFKIKDKQLFFIIKTLTRLFLFLKLAFTNRWRLLLKTKRHHSIHPPAHVCIHSCLAMLQHCRKHFPGLLFSNLSMINSGFPDRNRLVIIYWSKQDFTIDCTAFCWLTVTIHYLKKLPMYLLFWTNRIILITTYEPTDVIVTTNNIRPFVRGKLTEKKVGYSKIKQ